MAPVVPVPSGVEAIPGDLRVSFAQHWIDRGGSLWHPGGNRILQLEYLPGFIPEEMPPV
jgi:hypothetical protein